jgi:hypothetical protein
MQNAEVLTSLFVCSLFFILYAFQRVNSKTIF